MRTTFILLISFLLILPVLAQRKPVPGMQARIYEYVSPSAEKPVTNSPVNKPQVKTAKSTLTPSKVLMGSSANAYTLLMREQNCMLYDKQTGTLAHIHRGDQVTPGLATLNDIVASYSNDGGQVFGEKLVIQGSDTNRCRYPSGALFSPAGSSSINDVFITAAGPITNTAGWTENYFGSKKYDGSYPYQHESGNINGEIINQGMTVTSNGTASVGTMEGTWSSGYTSLLAVMFFGQFNPATRVFDWEQRTFDPQDYIYLKSDGIYQVWGAYFNMCWNEDGSIGYMYTRGVDARSAGNLSSFYPIVFRTTDGGNTWQALDYFDFGLLPAVVEWTYPLNTNWENPHKPWFFETDGVVDYRGNLHLFAKCLGAWSNHPDSLNYFHSGDLGSIFEFEYDQAGDNWMGWWIDTLRTEGPGADQTIYTNGTDKVSYDMRLQASVNSGRDKVFAVWTDTDIEFWGMQDNLYNLYPDLKVWGRDVNTNMCTEPTDKTYLEEGFGECYLMLASPDAIDGPGYTEIPVSIADIATNGLDPLKPIFHNYLKGVQVSDADFLTTPCTVKYEQRITENYPNPFTGVTHFDLSLSVPSGVKLTVTSLAGQQVAAREFGTLPAGIHTLDFDSGSLSPGLYFYNFQVGMKRYTGKMIIQ
jgi:hypothetical protein